MDSLRLSDWEENRLLQEDLRSMRSRCERAEQERDTLRAAIDRNVVESIYQEFGFYCYHSPVGYGQRPTRTEAEVAYRKKAFPGLDVPAADAAGQPPAGGERHKGDER